MPNLQVKDIDERLYESLRQLAAHEKRSISQEVVLILQKYLSSSNTFGFNPTEQFLEFSGSWHDENRDAAEIANDIRSNRTKTSRFGDINELFD